MNDELLMFAAKTILRSALVAEGDGPIGDHLCQIRPAQLCGPFRMLGLVLFGIQEQ
jgi:hypothetical protein